MANSARKNRHQKIDKRIGHKQARQATRRVLEDGAPTKVAHGVHWSPTIEQPPIHDEAVTGPAKKRKKGCKRNKYESHVIRAVSQHTNEYVLNPQTGKFEWRDIPWTRRRYRPPYECVNCGKSFYRIPKRSIQRSNFSRPQVEVEMDDHYDDFNIKMRLLGLKCKCLGCRDEPMA